MSRPLAHKESSIVIMLQYRLPQLYGQVGKSTRGKNRSSSCSGGNLFLWQQLPFFIRGGKVRLEGGNCRPPCWRASSFLRHDTYQTSNSTNRTNPAKYSVWNYAQKHWWTKPKKHFVPHEKISKNQSQIPHHGLPNIANCTPSTFSHLVALVPQQIFLQLFTHFT